MLVYLYIVGHEMKTHVPLHVEHCYHMYVMIKEIAYRLKSVIYIKPS